MTDPFDDPAARAWAKSAIDELLPMLRASAVSVALIPDEAGIADIKLAVELGLSILLDKPIIIAVTPGQTIPEHLARVVDEIIELDPADPASTARRIRDAAGRVLGS